MPLAFVDLFLGCKVCLLMRGLKLGRVWCFSHLCTRVFGPQKPSVSVNMSGSYPVVANIWAQAQQLSITPGYTRNAAMGP